MLLCIDLHAGVGVVTKLLTTRLRSLYTIHFLLFLLWKWLTFDNKLPEGNLDHNWSTWLIFPDNLSPYQGICSTWLIFSDNLSTLEEIIVPLDKFSQTSCRHMGSWKVYLIDFWSWSGVGLKDQRNDWQLHLWLCFSIYGNTWRNKHLAQLNRHYFFYFATLKLLQSLSQFQIILFENIYKTSQQCLLWMEMLQLLVKTATLWLHSNGIPHKRRNILVELYFCW